MVVVGVESDDEDPDPAAGASGLLRDAPGMELRADDVGVLVTSGLESSECSADPR